MRPYNFPPYRKPGGFPAYWKDDLSGQLPEAMMTYLQKPHLLTAQQFDLVRAWVVYAVKAPCWKWLAGEREKVVASIESASTSNELANTLHALLEAGVDLI